MVSRGPGRKRGNRGIRGNGGNGGNSYFHDNSIPIALKIINLEK